MSNILTVGSVDCNDGVTTTLLGWKIGKPSRVAEEFSGSGFDLPYVGEPDMSAPVESIFRIGILAAASVDAATAKVAEIATAAAALSPITIGLDGSAYTGTLTPRIAECIEIPMECPRDVELIRDYKTIIEIVVRRDPYVLAATETVIGANLVAAAPAGSAWPTDLTVATYGAGDGVVSLRFDDATTLDFTYTVPLLAARGLTAGFAVIVDDIDIAGHMTLAQIQKTESLGNEIMCHSKTHTADPAGYAAFYIETVGALASLTALGFNVRSFVQPGWWQHAYNFNPATGWTMGSPADLLLRANFAAYEGYFDAAYMALPVSGEDRYARTHYSPTTAASAQTNIDYAIANKKAVELLFHSNDIGGAGIPAADFVTVLDYLVTKVGSGDLTVLTPTQRLYAVSS